MMQVSVVKADGEANVRMQSGTLADAVLLGGWVGVLTNGGYRVRLRVNEQEVGEDLTIGGVEIFLPIAKRESEETTE